MAVSEHEKRTMKAYNVGYTLSIYEPKLLDKIIKSNPDNDFVKAMAVGREHREFHAGIPRNDHSREFKNGYYNGRTLAEYSPEVMERMLKSDGVNKDFKRGLEAAKTEYSIRSIKGKLAQERAKQQPYTSPSRTMQMKQEANRNKAPINAKTKGRDYDR